MVRTKGTFLCFGLVPKFIEFQDALKVIVNCFIYRTGLFSVVVSSKLPYGALVCHQMGNQSLRANFQELIKQM